MTNLPKLPSMPKSRKAKPVHACACGGCGQTTKGTWFPGHDGYCDGWAARISKGVVAGIEAVPEAFRAGVALRMAKHGVKVEVPMTSAERKAARKAERKAAKLANANAAPVETVEMPEPVEPANVDQLSA